MKAKQKTNSPHARPTKRIAVDFLLSKAGRLVQFIGKFGENWLGFLANRQPQTN